MYESMFGKGRVKVVCMEDLACNLQLFTKELSEFMLIDSDEASDLLFGKLENLGLPGYVGRVRRYRNSGKVIGRLIRHLPMRATAKGLRYLEQWTGKLGVSRDEERLLRRYYSQSNKMLTEYLGSRVQEYSYPL